MILPILSTSITEYTFERLTLSKKILKSIQLTQLQVQASSMGSQMIVTLQEGCSEWMDDQELSSFFILGTQSSSSSSEYSSSMYSLLIQLLQTTASIISFLLALSFSERCSSLAVGMVEIVALVAVFLRIFAGSAWLRQGTELESLLFFFCLPILSYQYIDQIIRILLNHQASPQIIISLNKPPKTLQANTFPLPIIDTLISSYFAQLFDQLLFASHNNITAMNQRATHFNLGNTSQNYGSVYHKDYNAKQADPNQIKGPNPFRSNSVNIGEKGSFTTTNKMLYKAWDNVQKAKLDDQKLHELKTHHFKLGSYQPNDILTTNKIYHDKKPINGQASKNQEESKNKMRAHYHDFKEQNFTNYNSTYSNQYTPKEGNYGGKVGATHTENAICFGNNQLPLVTTSNASFTPKRVDVDIKRNNETTLGIMLGDKSQPMETINQQYFNRKEISKNSLPQSTMKELRNTHFNLGLMPQQYQTQNDHYKKMHAAKQNQAKLTFEIPVYESGTWTDKNAQFNSSTTNKRELPNREVKPFERAAPNQRTGIQLGGHTSSYTSQFKNNFVPPSNGGRVQLQINKKSNVVIGNDIGYYQTQHKSSYKPSDLSNTRVNVDIKKLSKEDHFHIGGSTIEPKLTVYQDQHRVDIQNRNKIFHKENK